jgi:hypothetical protein
MVHHIPCKTLWARHAFTIPGTKNRRLRLLAGAALANRGFYRSNPAYDVCTMRACIGTRRGAAMVALHECSYRPINFRTAGFLRGSVKTTSGTPVGISRATCRSSSRRSG